MFGVSTPTFVTPDVQRQRAAAGREPEERVDLLLRQLPPPARARLHHAGAVDQDAEQPVRGALLQLRAVPAGRRPGDAVLGLAEDRSKRTPIPRLPLRPPDDYLRDAMVAALDAGRRRARRPPAAADRSAPDADRERRRAVAGKAVAARVGGDAAHPAAEVRLAGADRLCQAPLVQPVALHSPSIARSATRAAPGAACTWRCRRCGTT